MSFVRNISGGELDVPLLGRSVGDGETVEVPDFQPAHSEENPLPIVWPADKWEPVTAPAGDMPALPAAPASTDTEGM